MLWVDYAHGTRLCRDSPDRSGPEENRDERYSPRIGVASAGMASGISMDQSRQRKVSTQGPAERRMKDLSLVLFCLPVPGPPEAKGEYQRLV
jgi:hypothetical protein